MNSYCKKNTMCVEGYLYKTLCSHCTPFHFSMNFLNVIRLSTDFIGCGKEFHILGPNAHKFFVQNLTWLVFRISEVSLYLSLGGWFANLNQMLSLIKLGLTLFRVLKFSTQRVL